MCGVLEVDEVDLFDVEVCFVFLGPDQDVVRFDILSFVSFTCVLQRRRETLPLCTTSLS